ncbi:hypothetical protein COLO4_05885 [Corchorus olitorius]|uniref:Uncharacterized protein n=1 Tax=Corchorus olitorius TaxID=93759 RepID=A0A1R3KPP8_9ROSI|nr:hypothetical protein COLO4_05885 [Corchorus olitorius]
MGLPVHVKGLAHALVASEALSPLRTTPHTARGPCCMHQAS